MPQLIPTTAYSPIIPQIIEAESGGKITIPKDIRDKLSIKEKKQYAIFPIGLTVILSPIEKVDFRKEERIIRQTMKKRKITLNSLIKATEREGRQLYQEIYGQKKD